MADVTCNDRTLKTRELPPGMSQIVDVFRETDSGFKLTEDAFDFIKLRTFESSWDASTFKKAEAKDSLRYISVWEDYLKMRQGQRFVSVITDALRDDQRISLDNEHLFDTDFERQILYYQGEEENNGAETHIEYSYSEVLSWFGLQGCQDEVSARILSTTSFDQASDTLILEPYRISNSDELLSLSMELFLEKFDSSRNGVEKKIIKKSADDRLQRDELASLSIYDVANGIETDLGLIDKPTVLIFWATWCGPCIEERPVIQELASRFSGEYQFITVSVDDKLQKLDSFLGRNPLDGVREVWDHEKEVSEFFSIESYPTMIIIDEEGNTQTLEGLQKEKVLVKKLENNSQ